MNGVMESWLQMTSTFLDVVVVPTLYEYTLIANQDIKSLCEKATWLYG